MRPNLINRLKKAMKRLTRDDTEHGVEYYRADEVDALLAEQPAQVDGDTIVQTFTGLPRRKLRDLLSGGWEVNGVCFQRIETDGTVRRGAATTGGMVLWWNAEQPAQQEQEAGVAVFELQESGWEIICDGDWIQTLPLRTKLYTSPPAQRKPLTRKQLADAWIGTAHITHATERQIAYARAVEAAHGIKGDA